MDRKPFVGEIVHYARVGEGERGACFAAVVTSVGERATGNEPVVALCVLSPRGAEFMLNVDREDAPRPDWHLETWSGKQRPCWHFLGAGCP